MDMNSGQTSLTSLSERSKGWLSDRVAGKKMPLENERHILAFIVLDN